MQAPQATPPEQIYDVQAEAEVPEPEDTRCPQCQKELTDPHGLGWCQKCGYCRSLDEEYKIRKQQIQEVKQPNKLEIAGSMVGRLPDWFWTLIFGVFLVMVGCIFISGYYLPPDETFHRAMWTTMQVLIGIMITIAAQFIVLLHIAPEDPSLTFKDAIIPTKLWPLAMRHMPAQSAGLQWAVWGIAIAAGALIFIGGLKHWFSYLPGRENNPATRAALEAKQN